MHGEAAVPESSARDEGEVADRWDAAAARAVTEALAAQGIRAGGVIGRGGFGVVLAGERGEDGAAVAVKVSLLEGETAAEEMAQEAENARRAAGPHVPRVLWSGSVAGRPCMVLERIEAPTLAELLERQAGAPLELSSVQAWVRGLLVAVEAVHAAGLVHLDLKPENVFLRDDGSVVLVDFGLARPLGQRRPAAELAGAEPVGTAEYMSPEQCDDLPDLDERSDVYSAAVLVYELLAGAPPFWGQPADVREAQRSQRVRPLRGRRGVAAELDTVVRRALAKDRARRFSSIAELHAALQVPLTLPLLSSEPANQQSGSQARGPSRDRAARSVKERQKLGLLFFVSEAGDNAIKPLLAAGGGEIAERQGEQYTVAFGHDVSDNPAKPALSVAHHLTATGLTERVLLDVATVTVQKRPDGTRRYFGAVLHRRDRMPGEEDPVGVSMTRAAVDVLGDLEFKRVPGVVGRFVIGHPDDDDLHSHLGVRSRPLIGRDEQVAALLGRAREAIERHRPTLCIVHAQPGMGRTHLGAVVSESVERAFPAAALWRQTAQAGVVGARGRVLGELLKGLLDLPERADAALARSLFEGRLGAAVGAQVWAAGAFAMGYIPPTHPEVDRLAAAPGALRGATARALGEALRAAAQRRPLCLFLDDAHLADDAVLDAVEHATLDDTELPLFVCALVPDEFVEQRADYGSRAGGLLRLPLGPLAEDRANDLARLLLHPVEHVPPAVLQKLVQRTQCVPRQLVELVRGLKREGVVRMTDMGSRHYIATNVLDKVPDLPVVQWNARREVEALSPQLAGHARLASVLGTDFTLEELEALFSVLEIRGAAEQDTDLDPAVGVDRLVEEDILCWQRGGRIHFRYPLLRDTIYEMVDERRRRLVHRAALQVYEDVLELPEDERLPRVAMHAARSGERERAVDAYLALGHRLRDAQAYLPAEAAFGGALDNLGEAEGDPRVITAAHGRGLMRFRLGNNSEAVDDLQLARTRAHALDDKPLEAEIMLDEAMLLEWRHKIPESVALVHAAEELVPNPSPLLAARIALGTARKHHRAGEAEQCVRVGLQAAEQAAALGEAGYETRIIALLLVAPDCARLGRLDESRALFETVIAEAEAHSDLLHLGSACINRAFLWFELNDLPRLVEDLSRVTRLAHEIGEPFLEYIATNNLAEVLYWSAEGQAPGASSESGNHTITRATEVAERSLALAYQLRGEQSAEVSHQRTLLARIFLYVDQVERAREIVEAVRGVLATEGNALEGDHRWTPGAQLIFGALELGCAGECDPAPWEALFARAAEPGVEPQEQQEVHEAYARTLLRAGREREGQEAYGKAAQLARERTNMLGARILREYTQRFGEVGGRAEGG